MQIDWHLGDVVRKLREQRRWNQSKLAAHARLNKATIVDVEDNASGVKRETYEKLARALSLSLGDLFALVPTPSSVPDREVDEHLTALRRDVERELSVGKRQKRRMR